MKQGQSWKEPGTGRFTGPELTRLPFIILLGCHVLLVVPSALAQNGSTSRETPAIQTTRPELRVGTTGNGIHLDGHLNEPEWANADSITSLTQLEPVEGGMPTGRTLVKVLADDQQLIFGIVADDPDPSGIVAFDVRRDARLRDEDNIRIVLDPFLDGRSGVVFMVNPNGSRYDALVSRRGEGENSNWDQIWDASAVRTGSGWSVEIWIPIRSLTFNPELRSWGFNIERRIERLQETDRWASPERDYNFDQTSRAGLLTGLPDFHAGLGLSFRPFIAGNRGKATPAAGVVTNVEPGIDVTQRIGSNVEATLTVNTDFGETEVDARQTNLTRFPLFFPEKRTFFLQGSDIFDFGLGLRRDLIPFFSRRIGLLQGRKVDINVGGKVSGRVGNTNVGGLLVRTGGIADLTPANTLGVVRIKQNVLTESSAGFITTFGDPEGRSGSWMAGPDFTYQTSHFLRDKNLLLGAWGLVMGREGMTGSKAAYGFQASYPNELWDVSLNFKHLGNGFDPSLGFVPRPGTDQVGWRVGYSPRPEWSLVRQFFFEFEGSVVTRVDGSLQSWEVFTAPINLRLESGDGFEFNVIPQGEGLDRPFEVSEGVTIQPGRYDFLRYRLEGRFASKRPLSGQLTWRFGDFFTGTLNQIEITSVWTPTRLFAFEFSAEIDTGRLPEGNFTERLIQGRIRMNFSPDLELSSFIQYDNSSNVLASNTRLRWTFRPVGDLFVVYNHAVRDRPEDRLRFESNQLIVKVGYEVRI